MYQNNLSATSPYGPSDSGSKVFETRLNSPSSHRPFAVPQFDLSPKPMRVSLALDSNLNRCYSWYEARDKG
jgi:hypothetical protein